ncbi:MAG: hypothetical protein Q8O29_09460 [Polaromonas sp.]|nr:hypothetical protein [Polaromonas sp.]MDP2818484.1 hypothetical protein [Polaromonas sp.]
MAITRPLPAHGRGIFHHLDHGFWRQYLVEQFAHKPWIHRIDPDVLEVAFFFPPHVSAASVVVVSGTVTRGPVRERQRPLAMTTAKQASKHGLAARNASNPLRSPGLQGLLYLTEGFSVNDRRMAADTDPQVRRVWLALRQPIKNAHAAVDLAGKHEIHRVFCPAPSSKKQASIVQRHRNDLHAVTLQRKVVHPAHGFGLTGMLHQAPPFSVRNRRVAKRHAPAHEIPVASRLEHRAPGVRTDPPTHVLIKQCKEPVHKPAVVGAHVHVTGNIGQARAIGLQNQLVPTRIQDVSGEATAGPGDEVVHVHQ